MATSSIVSRCNSGNTSTPNAFSGRRYLKIREASDFLGISQPTCRQLVDGGEIASFRTIAGHRRLDTSSVLNYAYGEDWQSSGGETGTKILGIIRVSSRGQSVARGSLDKSSLDHQRDRIIQHCLGKHGREPDEIIESVGSGLNFDRPEFVQLVQRIVSGELRGATIVATDFTRICRFGVRLVEHLAEIGGCSIEYTMQDETEPDGNESLVQDVLSILTHFTARVSGAKTAKILTVQVDSETLRRGWELYQQYRSYRKVVSILEQEGFVDARNRPYKLNVLRKALIQNQDTLTELFGAEQETSFEKFAREHVRRGKQADVVLRQDVIDAYHRWCEKQGAGAGV